MNFFFILMKNGTGFNKTGQFVLVSRVHLLGKFSQGWPAFPLHITIAVYTKLCFSATFSTHIGHEKVDRKEGKFLFTLCSVASDKRYSYVVFFVHVYQLCAHITQRSFLTFPLSVFSFFFGGKWKYDNLVCLACFIRRYFSNVTFSLSIFPHVAPIIHTCKYFGSRFGESSSLYVERNSFELLINSTVQAVYVFHGGNVQRRTLHFYEMRINEILKFWWREFSRHFESEECRAWAQTWSITELNREM